MNETLALVEQTRTGQIDSSCFWFFFSPALIAQGQSHMVTNYAEKHSAECALSKVSFTY